MQMLVAPSKRKKTITAKEIEAVIATMARIPPKSVSSDDKATLASLETDLKRVVFGQNTAIEVLSSAIKLSRAGLRDRSEEHTSELQSLMRISYAVFCLKKKTKQHKH